MAEKKATHYWTEPFKVKSTWTVEKKGTDGTVLQTIPFATRKLADEFLETVNVYIDGKLLYTGT